MLLAKTKLNTRTVNLDHLCRIFSIDKSARKLHGALLDCRLLSEVYLELLGGRQTSLILNKPKSKEFEIKREAKRETDKANANQKLKDLGLTDDEIKAIKGIS